MTIAVGYDGGESAKRALDAAASLAKDLGEPIILVCGVAPAGGMGEEYEVVEDAIVDELAPAVAAAVEDLCARGFQAESVLVDSDPVGALETVMEQQSPRMLVVGYGQSGRIRAALFGAVAHKIVESSEVPVLVVP